MKVNKIMVFEKNANLLPYYQGMLAAGKIHNMGDAPDHFTKERRVTLILAFGFDKGGNPVASIKCPINPLPTRGEFQYISKSAVINSLLSAGWKSVDNIHYSIFNTCKKLFKES